VFDSVLDLVVPLLALAATCKEPTTPCPTGQSFNKDDAVCRCQCTVLPTGSKCPEKFTLDARTNCCIAPDTKSNNGSNIVKDEKTNNGGQKDEKTNNGGQKDEKTNNGGQKDEKTNNGKDKDDKTNNGKDKDDKTTTKNPATTQKSGSAAQKCPSGRIYDEKTKACVCDTVCAATMKVDPKTCACECATVQNCTKPTVWNKKTCQVS
jgi:hypothetical protein